MKRYDVGLVATLFLIGLVVYLAIHSPSYPFTGLPHQHILGNMFMSFGIGWFVLSVYEWIFEEK